MSSRPSGQPQVHDLFETPIVVDTLPDAARHNEALRTAILARREVDAGVQISNQLGWQSDKRLPEWGGPSLLALVDRIVWLADRQTVDTGAAGGAAPRFEWVPEAWANVSPKGASNQTHFHGGSVWSAVYYVDDGCAGAPPESCGGELAFQDPRLPAVTMAAPELRFRTARGDVHSAERRIRPVPGRILMFPSWLMHSVRPHRGEGMRVSIAVNLSARPARAEA